MVKVPKVKSLANGSKVYLCTDCKTYLEEGAYYPKCLAALKYVCRECNVKKCRAVRQNDPTINMLYAIRLRQKRRGVPCPHLDKTDIKYVLDRYDHACIISGQKPAKMTLIPVDGTKELTRDNAVPIDASMTHIVALPEEHKHKLKDVVESPA